MELDDDSAWMSNRPSVRLSGPCVAANLPVAKEIS